jgi:hypothetical protein
VLVKARDWEVLATLEKELQSFCDSVAIRPKLELGARHEFASTPAISSALHKKLIGVKADLFIND